MTGPADREQPGAAADTRASKLPPGLQQLAALLADGLGEFANATLGLDPAGAARLAELEGCRVLIRAHGPAGLPGPAELSFALCVSSGRLRLLAGAVDRPNTIVTGSLPQLVSWAMSRGRINPAGLRIDGDTRLLETLSAIAQGYSPDLERPLGRLLGPANATRLLATAELAVAGLRSVMQAAASGVRHGAGQWFATGQDLTGFLDELDELKLAVDRLEARVAAAERRGIP